MRETSGLASASVNGNSDINDISNIAEELVEISIGHLECEVTDEESLGRRVVSVLALSGCLVVNHEAASFENGLVLGLNRCGCLFSGFELNVSKAFAQSSSIRSNECTLNSSIFPKFSLKVTGSDIEQQVSNIDVRARR